MTKEETISKKLAKSLKPVFTKSNELKLYKCIISALKNQGIDVFDVEKIIIGIYETLPSHVELSEIIKLNEDIFIEDEKPNAGLKSLKKMISKDFDNQTANHIITQINSILNPTGKRKTYRFEIATGKEIVMHNPRSEVYQETISNFKGEEIPVETKILTCYPYEIHINNNPLTGLGRTFSIKWRTKNGQFFSTENMNVSEIENELTDTGYVMNNKLLKNTISALINMAEEYGLAEENYDIDTAGFYIQDNKLICVGYDLLDQSPTQIKEALLLIEDLKNWFENHEDKLATTLKHGLIAPFGFAKKQLGLPLELLIPYLYHFGKAGSGKTTIARIGLWFYNRPEMDKNDIGGTEFDTVPRIGEQLRKSTFGLLINEPETALAKKSCTATLKTSAERTHARQRISGKRMERILALATLSFASNIPLPNVEGLPRRFVQILYSFNEKKKEKEKQDFMNHFKLDNQETCEFNKLNHLGHFAVNEIKKDITLLKLDWKTLGNTLFKKAYEYCGMECPEWILSYIESVTPDDLEDEETEDIRMFFINEINKKAGAIKLYSQEGSYLNQEIFHTDEVKGSSDFEEKVWNVINEGLIGYMATHNTREGIREICFTNSLKKELLNNQIPCYSVASTAELLGWDYSPVYINGKTSRVMKVNFNKFLEFLYPAMEESQ